MRSYLSCLRSLGIALGLVCGLAGCGDDDCVAPCPGQERILGWVRGSDGPLADRNVMIRSVPSTPDHSIYARTVTDSDGRYEIVIEQTRLVGKTGGKRDFGSVEMPE